MPGALPVKFTRFAAHSRDVGLAIQPCRSEQPTALLRAVQELQAAFNRLAQAMTQDFREHTQSIQGCQDSINKLIDNLTP